MRRKIGNKVIIAVSGGILIVAMLLILALRGKPIQRNCRCIYQWDLY